MDKNFVLTFLLIIFVAIKVNEAKPYIVAANGPNELVVTYFDVVRQNVLPERKFAMGIDGPPARK